MGRVKEKMFADPREQFVMDFSPAQNPEMFPCAMDSRVFLKVDTNAMETRVCIEIEDIFTKQTMHVFLNPTEALLFTSAVLKKLEKVG